MYRYGASPWDEFAVKETSKGASPEVTFVESVEISPGNIRIWNDALNERPWRATRVPLTLKLPGAVYVCETVEDVPFGVPSPNDQFAEYGAAPPVAEIEKVTFVPTSPVARVALATPGTNGAVG